MPTQHTKTGKKKGGQNESFHQKQRRLQLQIDQNITLHHSETAEQHQRRLQRDSEQQRTFLQTETLEQHQRQLQRDSEQHQTLRQNQYAQQNQRRLAQLLIDRTRTLRQRQLQRDAEQHQICCQSEHRNLDYFNDWSISADDFFSHLNCEEENGYIDQFFSNIESNPLIAVLLWYLNARYGRFDSFQELDQTCHNKEIDVAKICEEINQEVLTNTDFLMMLDTFFKNHSYIKGDFVSCGACGLRQQQQKTNPTVNFKWVNLEKEL
jgi:hypothetical protein